MPTLELKPTHKIVMANELGIGPMGFGGKTTLLGVKTCAANRLPASYFVSIKYMCCAYRRQGATLDAAKKIGKTMNLCPPKPILKEMLCLPLKKKTGIKRSGTKIGGMKFDRYCYK